MNLLDAMSLRQGGDLCGSASFEKTDDRNGVFCRNAKKSYKENNRKR